MIKAWGPRIRQMLAVIPAQYRPQHGSYVGCSSYGSAGSAFFLAALMRDNLFTTISPPARRVVTTMVNDMDHIAKSEAADIISMTPDGVLAAC